jgi:hypothetical protein
MDRLNWMDDGTHEATAPVIASTSLLFPVPAGMEIPPKYKMATHQFPAEPAYGPIQAWTAALLYANTNNDGKSVSEGGPLFNNDHFLGTNTFNFDVRLPLFPTPNEFMTLCPIANSGQFAQVEEHMTSLANGTLYHLGSNIDPTPSTPPGNPTPSHGPGTVTPTKDIVVVEKETKAEKEQSIYAKQVETKWMISFATIDDTSNTVVVNTCAASFTEILEKTNKTAALRLLTEHCESAIHAVSNKDDRLSAYVNLDPTHVTSGMLTSIRNFNVFKRMPQTDIQQFGQQMSIANFLPINKTCLKYQETCVDEPNQLFQKEYSTSETKDGSRGGLYFGSLRTATDVIAMTANWFTFITHFFPDFPKSECYKSMYEYLKLMMTQEFTAWYEGLAPAHEGIRYNLFQDIVQISGSFFAVGNHPDTVSTYNKKDPLSADIFSPAKLVAQTNMRRLCEAITIDRVGLYDQVPIHIKTFLGGTSEKKRQQPVPASAPTQDTKRVRIAETARIIPSSPQAPQRSSATSGQSSRDSSRDAANKQKGMLILIGEKVRIPPYTNVRAKKPDGTGSVNQLCTFYMTQGYCCTSANCVRPHYNKLSEMNDATQTKLKAYMADSNKAKYKYASGARPTTGNNN